MGSIRAEQGFTLIELIMVIVVVAVLSVYATARSPGVTLQLRSNADQLAMDIRQTQAYSMSNTGTGDYRILRTASDTYQIRDPSGTTLSTTTLSGVTLTDFNVTFDGRGQSSAGVTITLTMGSSSTTVEIVTPTGLVR
ncbi:MAG: prepilin-type N-terminal cleavage/methylation domain-containing protein [Magnetococcales bacterium]|nr:prepilin-type N-terminal cleavage/methylation domain-containing protein [Magnetococcales bacterium]